MGLTWIDHDTIEQPIEEISKKSDNLDIEFTVEKLRQNRDDVLLPLLLSIFASIQWVSDTGTNRSLFAPFFIAFFDP